MRTLLMPGEVDRLLGYPRGRSVRLAKGGKLPHVKLPDGAVRFFEHEIEELLTATREPAREKEVAHA